MAALQCHSLRPSLAMWYNYSMSTDSHQFAITPALLQQTREASKVIPTTETSERIDQLFLVCRDAAELEQLHLKSGKPLPSPAPWPESTWEFLRHEAGKHHE